MQCCVIFCFQCTRFLIWWLPRDCLLGNCNPTKQYCNIRTSNCNQPSTSYRPYATPKHTCASTPNHTSSTPKYPSSTAERPHKHPYSTAECPRTIPAVKPHATPAEPHATVQRASTNNADGNDHATAAPGRGSDAATPGDGDDAPGWCNAVQPTVPTWHAVNTTGKSSFKENLSSFHYQLC